MSHQIIGEKPSFTKKSPLWHNKLLKVGKKTLYWRTWVKAGIVSIEDVFENDCFMSFGQIMIKYRIPQKDFWKYLQLRSCIMSIKRKHPLINQTSIQEILQNRQQMKGGASRFYSTMRQSLSPKLNGLKRAWEEDLEK